MKKTSAGTRCTSREGGAADGARCPANANDYVGHAEWCDVETPVPPASE